MLHGGMRILVFVAAGGSWLVAGVFFAFSTFVMAALARVSAERGIPVMQAINATVINPAFMLAFLGTALASAVLAASSLKPSAVMADRLILAAGLVYLLGGIGVTMVCNVPMNDALATLQPSSDGASAFWRDYLDRWTAWNHVRAIATAAAAFLFTLAYSLWP